MAVCQIQRDLNTKVLDRYTDMFPKVCTDSIRYSYNKIESFNKRYLQETEYIQSRLNLRVDQINQDSKYNLKSVFIVETPHLF